MSRSIVDKIASPQGLDLPYDIVIEFLIENKNLMERVISVYGRMIEDMIEQKYLEEFEEFVTSRNKI